MQRRLPDPIDNYSRTFSPLRPDYGFRNPESSCKTMILITKATFPFGSDPNAREMRQAGLLDSNRRNTLRKEIDAGLRKMMPPVMVEQLEKLSKLWEEVKTAQKRIAAGGMTFPIAKCFRASQWN
jgi:hypothetical protein